MMKEAETGGFVLWHRRLGHALFKACSIWLRETRSGIWNQTRGVLRKKDFGVRVLQQAYSRFPKSWTLESTEPLELVHIDVCTPKPVTSIDVGKQVLDHFPQRLSKLLVKQKSGHLRRSRIKNLPAWSCNIERRSRRCKRIGVKR